jgi:uncharacterized protein YndB with AHSA1/START domain
MTEPLRMSFEVACAVDRAFEVWTSETSRWWPPTHTVSGEAAARVQFENRIGGRIFERTPGGDEHEWGWVTAWEPPRRLVYQWHIRVDRADATEVEIRFEPAGDGVTRVEIEHRGWERLGARGPGWRDVNRGGWDGVLPAYRLAAAAGRR